MKNLTEYLEPRERREYEALLAMFETDGWRVVQEKLKEAEKIQLNLCAGADSERTLFRGQGRLVFLREMISYEDSVKEGVEVLATERQLEQELEQDFDSPGNEG